MKKIVALTIVGLAACVANAGLATTHTDGTGAGATVNGSLSGGEYGGGSYVYTGGGTGFGGTVGNGRLYMDSDATNLYIGFQPGAELNDLVTILLDTRSGGFTDATMNDTSDGGRRASSNLAGNADDAFDPNFLPDFSVVIASFGIVSFELTGGSLNFLNYDGTFTGNSASQFREYAIPLATLGLAGGGNVDFIVGYVADSGFGSNESMPASPMNAGANVGFDTVSAGYPDFHRFVVPAPGAVALAGVAGLLVARRRR
jgi:hypothetical protein